MASRNTCDHRQCPATATTFYGKREKLLGFCAHHSRRLMAELLKQDWVVVVENIEGD